jgi:hypothetical protein
MGGLDSLSSILTYYSCNPEGGVYILDVSTVKSQFFRFMSIELRLISCSSYRGHVQAGYDPLSG